MKELLTVTANICASFNDDKTLVPQVEIAIVMSEPTYRVDAVGEVIRQREISQCRFVASPATLLKLSKLFSEFASEAEQVCKESKK